MKKGKKLLASLLAILSTICFAIPVNGCNGHTCQWDEGVTIKEATCTEDGSILYHCTQPDCEKEKTSAIPALGHDYDMDTCLRCGAEDPSFHDPEIDDGGIADTPPFSPPIEPDLK